MPGYSFEVREGRSSTYASRIELTDAREARSEAVRFVGESIRDTASRIELCPGWSVEVTDDSGASLLRLEVTITHSGHDRAGS